jgi:hypothetical protein
VFRYIDRISNTQKEYDSMLIARTGDLGKEWSERLTASETSLKADYERKIGE